MSSAGSSNTQLVRLKQDKHTFEVMTVVGSVPKYRKQQLGYDNVVQVEEVWKNQHKGERANAAELSEAFGTENLRACIMQILEKGEVQLTAAERKEMTDKRRLEVVSYIHKYYTDPRSNTPHPMSRIESALAEIKYHVDYQRPATIQAQEVLKKLPDVLPLRKSEVTGILTVPHAHVGHVQGIIARLSIEVKSESYNSEGCQMEVSLVPGDYDTFLSQLSSTTKGEVDFTVHGLAGSSGASAAAASSSPSGKAGGKGPKAGHGKKK